MPSQKLVDFIKQQLKSGVAADAIKAKLLAAGWKPDVLEEGFVAAIEKPKAQEVPRSVITRAQEPSVFPRPRASFAAVGDRGRIVPADSAPQAPNKNYNNEMYKKMFSFLSLVFVAVVAAGIVSVVYLNKLTAAQQATSANLQQFFGAEFNKKTSELDNCQTESKVQAEQYGYDKIRMADAANILLALQDYNAGKGDFPDNLAQLVAGNYLAGGTADPEFQKGYYYKKIDKENFTLCVYLSTGVWGANRDQCPTKEDYASGKVN